MQTADQHYSAAKIYCSGLSPLLYLCCSGLFSGSHIIFVYFENINDMGTKKDIEFILSISKKIAQLFGHTIEFQGPLKLDAREFGADFSGAWYEELNIDIQDGEFITKNLEKALRKSIENKKVNLLPEGSSCYIPLYETIDPNLFNGSVGVDGAIRRFVDKLSSLSGPIGHSVRKIVCTIKRVRLNKRLDAFENIFLLPVRSPKKLFDLQNFPNVKIFPESTFHENLTFAANRFAEWFPDADYRGLESPFFHPASMGFHDDEYAEYAQQIREHVCDKAILVKDHPSLLRSRSEMFEGFNLLILPETLQAVPGELFFFQTNFTYIGYTSTLLFFVDEERRVILEPNSNLSREVYGKKFDFLLHLVGADSLIKRFANTLMF